MLGEPRSGLLGQRRESGPGFEGMDAHIPPIQVFSTVRTPYAGGVKPPPNPVPENALAMGLVQHNIDPGLINPSHY